MDSRQFVNDIREIKKYDDEIFSLKNGHWQVNNKFSILSKYASFFYDSHLDIIRTVSLKILSERHSMFDLEPEDRFAAALYGKVQKYSPELRRGICETLVFLGIHGKELKNCSLNKPESIPNLTIGDLFNNADWRLWASLNELLPLLAEGAPEEFLLSVENALNQNPCPFDELFHQEGKGGITGSNYMTGLYWALETLAWSEEYLSRSILVLAELASHDPGGRWANRPINSIITILLPWFPQTNAPIEKRVASLKGIQRNYPDIAWKILIGLLPNHQQVSSGSHKPSFREFIPDNWKDGVSNEAYWKQVVEYASMAVYMVKGKTNYVSELLNNLDNIPQPAFNTFLEYLSSDEIVRLPDEQRQPIWETMISFVKKHREFSDAKWALPAETVDLLEETANKIAPFKPEILYRHLFLKNDFYLMDRNVDWQKRQYIISNRRIEAVKQIYEINKTNSIIAFAENVETPEKVGFSFSHIADEEVDHELLPVFLDYDEPHKKDFIAGYIWGRYKQIGFSWIESLSTTNWSTEQKCNLLLFLPFEEEIWEKATELLGDHVGDYWKRIRANQVSTESNLLPAIECLLKYGRPRLALECIYEQFSLKKVFFKEHAIKALIDAISSDEPFIDSIDIYDVTEIIKMLQNDPDVDEDSLLRIEWLYLPLLNEYNDARPKVLEKYLSQKPEFFIEVIQLLYRSKKKNESEQEVDERTKNIAMNAWKLLYIWKRPPGKMDDGSFSGEALKEWYNKVKTQTTETGHYEVAMDHLGKVLFYADPDPNGLWIHQTAAEILDEAENASIRQGFNSEVYNSGGFHWVDTSGKTENELANLWRKKAEEVEKIGLIRFASSLKELANSFDREAERVKSDFAEEKGK
jgi:hypothetical protein